MYKNNAGLCSTLHYKDSNQCKQGNDYLVFKSTKCQTLEICSVLSQTLLIAEMQAFGKHAIHWYLIYINSTLKTKLPEQYLDTLQ